MQNDSRTKLSLVSKRLQVRVDVIFLIAFHQPSSLSAVAHQPLFSRETVRINLRPLAHLKWSLITLSLSSLLFIIPLSLIRQERNVCPM